MLYTHETIAAVKTMNMYFTPKGFSYPSVIFSSCLYQGTTNLLLLLIILHFLEFYINRIIQNVIFC